MRLSENASRPRRVRSSREPCGNRPFRGRCPRYNGLSTVIGRSRAPMEHPDIPALLQQAHHDHACDVTLDCPGGRLKTVNRCYP